MSQAGIISISGGGGGGSPIEMLTGDDLIAVPPTANNLNLVGGSSSADNHFGIATSGNIGTSTETVSLTNRAFNPSVVTTTNLVTQTLLTFPLGASLGTFKFHMDIVAYDTVNLLSAGYTIANLVVRKDGVATAQIIGTGAIDVEEEGLLVNDNVLFSVVGNDLVFTVQGINPSVINWNCLLTYIFVGA